MKTKWLILLGIIITLLVSMCSVPAFAEEKATPDEVYNLILSAIPIIEKLGDEGLKAFNDPKGEFVYKDTYVFAVNCDSLEIVAHPSPKMIGYKMGSGLDKNPDPAKKVVVGNKLCEAGDKPYGEWVAYYWTKLNDPQPYRKISFSIKVAGTKYILVAGIYDETASVDELNAKLGK